ncbi:peptidoglycan-binding domain-containing protein [Acidimangrovimonas pyrenivorans]|uniref:Peptidoglycan-binding domain-containing protein n=1 Tax=Acidimangrovimonas pyrenivorans TaxID=2030798 RepID=A0ABV7AIX9_9RHOB
MIRPFLLGLAALGLAACSTASDPALTGDGPQPGARQSLAGAILRRTQPGPPSTVPGECWAHETLPAVIETTTEHVETAPGQFETRSHQRIVRPREAVWFRRLCPAVMSPDVIATLQRALKVRRYYGGPVTGEMDAPTRDALRRYQSERGLASAIPSLAAARLLGVATYDLYSLQQPDG